MRRAIGYRNRLRKNRLPVNQKFVWSRSVLSYCRSSFISEVEDADVVDVVDALVDVDVVDVVDGVDVFDVSSTGLPIGIVGGVV